MAREIASLKQHNETQRQFIEELERRIMRTEQESVKDTELVSNRIQMDLSKASKTQNVVEFAVQEMEVNPTPKSIREHLRVSVPVEKPKKRNIPVAFQDVKTIGDTMKYRMMAMHIDLNDLEDYLFDDEMAQNGFTTFLKLRVQLQKYPFDLNQRDAHLIAKYAIENDLEPLSESSQQFNPYVRSVMRRLLGNYKLQQVVSAFGERIKDALTRYRQFLISTIQQIAGAKATRITKEQFVDAIAMMQLELTTAEVDYLIVQGIMESEGAHSLNYMEMLRYEEEQQEQEQETFMITQPEQIALPSEKKGMSIIEEQDAEKGSVDELD